MRILFVDDVQTIHSLFAGWFVRTTFSVGHAYSGDQAAAIIADEPFDIVITDLIMTEGNGLDLIKYLQKQHPDIKIIAMSAGIDAADIDIKDTLLGRAKELGAHAVMSKPFSFTKLCAALYDVLGAEALESIEGIPPTAQIEQHLKTYQHASNPDLISAVFSKRWME